MYESKKFALLLCSTVPITVTLVSMATQFVVKYSKLYICHYLSCMMKTERTKTEREREREREREGEGEEGRESVCEREGRIGGRGIEREAESGNGRGGEKEKGSG